MGSALEKAKGLLLDHELLRRDSSPPLASDLEVCVAPSHMTSHHYHELQWSQGTLTRLALCLFILENCDLNKLVCSMSFSIEAIDL